MYVIADQCDILNYADDNSICCHGSNVDDVITNLERVSNVMLTWFKQNYIQPNPDKFQFILFHNAVKSSNKSVGVGDTILEKLESVKLLGIFVDRWLNFNLHISETCKNAGKQLSALGRLANILSTEDKYRYVLFECFILLHFNYCPVVWHCCNISDMKKLENIQKRAPCYVFKDYSSYYRELRQKANKPLLYVQRLRQILLEVYKIVNKIGQRNVIWHGK